LRWISRATPPTRCWPAPIRWQEACIKTIQPSWPGCAACTATCRVWT